MMFFKIKMFFVHLFTGKKLIYSDFYDNLYESDLDE